MRGGEVVGLSRVMVLLAAGLAFHIVRVFLGRTLYRDAGTSHCPKCLSECLLGKFAGHLWTVQRCCDQIPMSSEKEVAAGFL